ncbi:MAG: isoaspartyl peptidase/L-asparaginase [Myxococcota bacterium]|nr:isoaspartyl peptidase/L-asparaginase [Myxococcota bacterium]
MRPWLPSLFLAVSFIGGSFPAIATPSSDRGRWNRHLKFQQPEDYAVTNVDLTRVATSWGIDGGQWAVLVHGGAGDVATGRVERHVAGCRVAADAAAEVLRSGGSALDAVQRAVVVLEDDPSFNAGTGACLNEAGLVELDAAIMEGSRLRVGGVCALPPFVHPIAVARAVLDDGRHVLYAAEGAARFAVEHGFTPAAPEAMITAAAREQWAAAQMKVPHDDGDRILAGGAGTVGAVARDARGTVAAATSTGGRVNKRIGRVGDSPIPGAGTYADDDAGASSVTGHGEAVLRLSLGKSAVDLLRQRVHPEEAARAAIRTLGTRLGASGGIVLVDRSGRLGLARNTAVMTWAAAGEAIAPDFAGA